MGRLKFVWLRYRLKASLRNSIRLLSEIAKVLMQAEVHLVERWAVQRIPARITKRLAGVGGQDNGARVKPSGRRPLVLRQQRIARHVGAVVGRARHLELRRRAISQVDRYTACHEIDRGQPPSASHQVGRAVHARTPLCVRGPPARPKAGRSPVIARGATFAVIFRVVDPRVIAVLRLEVARSIVDRLRPREGIQNVESARDAAPVWFAAHGS